MLNILTTLAISQYRSLHEVVLPLNRLTVITGENGTGKSNLYRALRLLSDTANGKLIGSLANEGGLDKVLWAGPEKITKQMKSGEHPVQGQARQNALRMRLGFTTDSLSYSVSLGYPIANPTPSMFDFDPEIKQECIWANTSFHPNARLVMRDGGVLKVREGRSWKVIHNHIPSYESMFTQAFDNSLAPEVWQIKRYIQSWRFYDHFRTDNDAPARIPQIGTFTPVLHADGSNLSAAIQTIIEIGDLDALNETIADAFDGARISINNVSGMFILKFHQYGLLRPLTADELSDGTLRYILLAAALLTPRPPSMMVLNEPETSLHPDLLPALARLIVKASEHSQIWVISHANRLVAGLAKAEHCHSTHLYKELGQTQIMGQDMMNQPSWKWADGNN